MMDYFKSTKRFKLNLLSFIILSLFYISCNNKTISSTQLSSYNYTILNKDNRIIGYYKRTVTIYDTKIRTDSIFKFDKNKILEDQYVEQYQYNKNGVSRNNDLYLIKNKDSCFTSKNLINTIIKTCYISKEVLKTNDSLYNESYKFLETEEIIDGLEKVMHYDKNFVLIKEEIKEGSIYYKVLRSNN